MSEPALPVLHLLDERSPGLRGSLDACRVLLANAPEDQRVCLLGGSMLDVAAADAGIREFDRIAVPLREPTLGVRALRRLVLDRSRPVILHAWSTRALRSARRAIPEYPLVATVVDGLDAPAPGQAHLLRRAVLGVCGPSARTEWTDVGAPAENVVLLPPPIEAAPVVDSERTRARSALGLSEGDLALVHLGTAPCADAVRFMFLVGLLVESGVETIGLIPCGATQLGRGLRYLRTSPTGAHFIVSDLPARTLLAAADLSVYEGGGMGPSSARPPRPAAATLAVSQALSRGLPVAAPRAAVSDVPALESLPDVGWAANGTLPELARVLLAFASEPDRRKEYSISALRHFRDRGLQAGFVEGVRSIWARLRRSHAPGAAPAEARS